MRWGSNRRWRGNAVSGTAMTCRRQPFIACPWVRRRPCFKHSIRAVQDGIFNRVLLVRVSRKRVENCPESQRSVDNPKNGPQKRSKPLCGGW